MKIDEKKTYGAHRGLRIENRLRQPHESGSSSGVSMLRTLVVVLTLVSACRSSTDADDLYLAGPIVARDLQISIGAPPSIHVRESSDECGVIFLVRSSTEIRRRVSSGRTVPASYADLTIGTRVRVWTTVVLESCPGQSAAHVVEIQP